MFTELMHQGAMKIFQNGYPTLGRSGFSRRSNRDYYYVRTSDVEDVFDALKDQKTRKSIIEASRNFVRFDRRPSKRRPRIGSASPPWLRRCRRRCKAFSVRARNNDVFVAFLFCLWGNVLRGSRVHREMNDHDRQAKGRE